MKKRIIGLLLALSMMISLVPVSALANTGGGIDPAAYASNEPLPDLVMNSATGLPMAESGNGWTYSGGKLTLTSGEWNFSYTHPANGAGETLSEVKCIVQINEGATVKGGTFTKVVNNGVNDRENNVSVKGGIIAGGTFKSSVNNCGGTIKAGEFTHCWNDNLDDAKGTIEGGTFASNGNFDSVTNYGIISGGIFNGLVTSYWKGVIENGTFNEKVSNYGSISGGYFLSADNKYDTASKVSGGVFKTIPSKVEDTSNLYKIQFDSESGAETTNTLSVDNHDFGKTSVYVVGKDDTELTVTAKDKILTSVNNKANTTANSNSITFKPGEVKLDDEKEGNAYLLKLNAKIYNGELVIGTDGKPVTEGRKPYGDNGVKGNGWTYENGTLTILTGHTESFTGPGVNKKLKVNVVVQKGAAVESGRFYKTVENHGTMSQALFCGNVTNTGDGTMNKCTFWDFDFTGNLTITITNEGEMEECIVMNDVTMLTNKGTMIRSSVGAKTVQGNGTYDTCLLAKNYGIAGTHKVTTKNETDKIMVRLVNDDGIQYYAEVEETEVYFTGTPRLKVQIGRYDDRWIRIPLTNVNGDENYGFTLSRDNFYIFAVPAEGDVILNDTVKYMLTLQFAEIVNDDGTTPTSGTYVEGEKIRIRPNFGTDSEKVFDGWMSEDINVDTEIVYDDKTDNGTYILTMPGKNATVDAKYKDKAPTTYTLTVVDGKTSTGKTSEELKEGTEVAVDANVPDDKVFTGWTVSDGVKLSYIGADVDLHSEQIIFNMPAANVTLTANLIDQRKTILFNSDGTLNLDGVKNNSGDGWYYSEGALYLNPATATEYDFAHVNPQNEDGAKLDAVNVPIHVVKSTVTIAGGTFKAEVESTVADATFKNCIFKGEVDIQAICNVDNCIFTKSSTITDIYIAENCLFEEKPDESKVATKELTEENGATITATLDGCEGEVSGTKLYFTGTPTLKVKVKGATVEKANGEDVGQADENGWYTVTAAEDGNIKLTKSTPTPNPDDQPTTYTITTDSYGKVNGGASATVKENDWVHMTVAEVPEGMTFDYWDIPDALLKALQKQNSGFRNNVENLNFQMPNMGEEEQTFAIKANFRSSELPGEDDGPSTLGTMATVAVGGAAAGILVWQGVSLGVDSYLQLNLPKGVAVPANRRELVKLLWETAGKPETALPSLYSDLPAEEIELQKATRWAIDNGLVKPADDNDASRFDPNRYVTKYDVFGAWLKLKKLMK